MTALGTMILIVVGGAIFVAVFGRVWAVFVKIGHVTFLGLGAWGLYLSQTPGNDYKVASYISLAVGGIWIATMISGLGGITPALRYFRLWLSRPSTADGIKERAAGMADIIKSAQRNAEELEAEKHRKATESFEKMLRPALESFLPEVKFSFETSGRYQRVLVLGETPVVAYYCYPRNFRFNKIESMETPIIQKVVDSAPAAVSGVKALLKEMINQNHKILDRWKAEGLDPRPAEVTPPAPNEEKELTPAEIIKKANDLVEQKKVGLAVCRVYPEVKYLPSWSKNQKNDDWNFLGLDKEKISGSMEAPGIEWQGNRYEFTFKKLENYLPEPLDYMEAEIGFLFDGELVLKLKAKCDYGDHDNWRPSYSPVLELNLGDGVWMDKLLKLEKVVREKKGTSVKKLLDQIDRDRAAKIKF